MRNDDHDEPLGGVDDDDFDLESLPETDVDVSCPWCGETVAITVDPWGGADQVYAEDCEVCCRPWRVHVSYDSDGIASVQVDPEE
jgi:hypothetical protein